MTCDAPTNAGKRVTSNVSNVRVSETQKMQSIDWPKSHYAL